MCTEWARAYGRVCVCKRESCCCGPPSLWKCCCWGLFLRRPYCFCFLSSHSSSPRNYFSRMWAKKRIPFVSIQMFLNLYAHIMGKKLYQKSGCHTFLRICMHACVFLHRSGQQVSFITVKMPNKLSTPPCLLLWHLCPHTYRHIHAHSGRAALLRHAQNWLKQHRVHFY